MLGCQLLQNFPNIYSQFLYLSLWTSRKDFVKWCHSTDHMWNVTDQEGDIAHVLIKPPMCPARWKVLDRTMHRTA